MKTLRVHDAARVSGFHILAALLACIALGHAAPRPAQPEPAPTELSSNRYLIVVDTSRAMEPRKRAMLQTVEDLLKSGMGGEMRAGDTLGVWTYNADLYAGRFPLQRWSPQARKAITSHLVAFLKGQKFELLPVLESVLPALDGILRNSELITVVFVTCGDGFMQGTPCDHQINEFWDQFRDKQKAAKLPLVVVLRAREGVITDYSLNLPPRAVRLPPLPAQTQVAAAPPQPAAKETPRKPQPPAAQALITSEKKPKPLQPPKADEAPAARLRPTEAVATNEPARKETPPAPPAPAAKVEAAKVVTASVKPIAPAPAPAPASNAPPVIKAEQPQPPAPITEIAKAEPRPTVPPKPAPQPPPAQTPPVVQPAAPSPAPAPKPEPPKATVEKPVAVVAAQPPAQPPPAAPKPEPAKPPEPKPAQPAPAPVATAPLPPAPAMPAAKAIEAPKIALGPKPTFEPSSAPHAPPVATPVVNAVVPGTPAPEKKPAPAAAPSPSREAAVAPSATASNAASSLALTPSSPPAPRASPPAPVQSAVATPAESFLSQKTPWIAGGLLALAACGFGWLAMRRSRATPHGSLITRSLDHDKKP